MMQNKRTKDSRKELQKKNSKIQNLADLKSRLHYVVSLFQTILCFSV